jgi:sulfur relay protein TusB/DsrH
MLFLLKTPDIRALDMVLPLAGDNDRELLLISDGVYLAVTPRAENLVGFGFDAVYAEQKAVGDRGLATADFCSIVDMNDIVALLLDHGKIINL